MPLHIGKGQTAGDAIKRALGYIKDPVKTENGILVTSYGCTPQTAEAEFMLMRREYLTITGRRRGKDDVLAYHLRQSFKPGEITPEEANRIGCELAKRFTHGQHAYVVATHEDRRHVHSHIIISAVNLDCDRKFRNFWGSTKAVRRLNDTICVENGYSIVADPKSKGQTYDKWLGNQKKPSQRERICYAIDEALAQKPKSFEELLDKSFKTLNTGEKVTGIVTAIGPTEVQVDLGCKQAGYINIDELSADPNVKPEDVVKVGDEIETYIIRVNDVEGYAMLSKKRLDAVKVWEDIEEARENKTTLEGKVTEENKGGIVVNVKGIRVFVPASQSGVPKGGDLSEMVGKTVQLRMTEVNRARRRVVGSIRSVAAEQRKAAQEKIWSEIEVGKQYHGTVKSLTSYGAFVDIGGVDGMVHVSELSWNRIKNPSEVVKVGDEIDVYVIALDPEKRKISLGYKTEATNPWTLFNNQFQVGDVAKVKIVKLMTFGAFAEIIPGVDGLIHISQIADRRIGKPEDVLSEGQEVDAKIIDIDQEHKRISLSIRALLAPAADEAEDAE